jgi:hypothetical protein
MYPICASASVLDHSIVSQVSATNPSVMVDDNNTPAAHAASIISILSQEDNGVEVHRSQSVMDDGTMPEIPSLSTYDDNYDALPRSFAPNSKTLEKIRHHIDDPSTESNLSQPSGKHCSKAVEDKIVSLDLLHQHSDEYEWSVSVAVFGTMSDEDFGALPCFIEQVSNIESEIDLDFDNLSNNIAPQ